MVVGAGTGAGQPTTAPTMEATPSLRLLIEMTGLRTTTSTVEGEGEEARITTPTTGRKWAGLGGGGGGVTIASTPTHGPPSLPPTAPGDTWATTKGGGVVTRGEGQAVGGVGSMGNGKTGDRTIGRSIQNRNIMLAIR